MIAKVTKGASFGGLTGYLYGPGRHEEHIDAHMVGGNLAVEDQPRVIAAELRDVARENPRVRRPVFHASLSLPEGERLSDEQWHQAGQTFMDHMGFRAGESEAPWAIVRHDGDKGRHAHIVASRVRFDCSTVSDSYDYKRSHEACRAVEVDLDLSSPQLSPEHLASVSRSEREAAERRGVAPERANLRQALEEARDSSDGTRQDFEQRAGQRGVLLRANESPSTGRMNGYSASLQDWKDSQGQQVWMPASKVHKSLRWQQLDSDLAERRRQRRGTEPEPRSQAARAMRPDTETQKTPATSPPTPPQVQQEENAPMPTRQEDDLAAANRRLEDELQKEREDKEHAEQQYVNHMRYDAVWDSQPDAQRTAEQHDSQLEHEQPEQESERVPQQEPQLEEQQAELVEEQQAELVDERDEAKDEPRESQAAQVMRESREREREQELER